MQNNSWQLNEIDWQIIDLALLEDMRSSFVDVTTDTIFDNNNAAKSAKIICKNNEDVIVSGLAVVSAILSRVNADFEVITSFKDGNFIKNGETLLTIKSDIKSILKTERIMLNFLRHLCAVATLTKKFVDLVKDTNLKILDTRKTSPGMRHLEKYAVYCGGGVNHRVGLYDAFMVKDNHIDLIGGTEKALQLLPTKDENNLAVIIEIRTLDELKSVLKYGENKVDRVLLDNMDIEKLRLCVELCKGVFATEASGNINLDTVLDIAKTGVDYASVGMLTYAAGNVDLSMVVEG